MGSGASSFKKERGKTKETVELKRVAPLDQRPKHKNKFTEPATATTKGEPLGQVIHENRTIEEGLVPRQPDPEPERIAISNADEHCNEGTSEEPNITKENVEKHLKRMESSVGKESFVAPSKLPMSSPKHREKLDEEASENIVTLNEKPETGETNKETFADYQISERPDICPSDDEQESASCQLDSREGKTPSIISDLDAKSQIIRNESKQSVPSDTQALIDKSEATEENDQTIKTNEKIPNRSDGPVAEQCDDLVTEESNRPTHDDALDKALTGESNAISNDDGGDDDDDIIVSKNDATTKNKSGNKNGMKNMEKSVEDATPSGNTEQLHALNGKPETSRSKSEETNIPHETNQTKPSSDVNKVGRLNDGASKSKLANIQDNPHLSSNLMFYQNKIKSRPPPGHNIEEMLNWFGDFNQLEGNHSYIQWLFPIAESSGMNVHAQALQPHEAEAIRADKIAHERVLKAFKMMLNFYGMKLDERSEKVTRDPHIWKDRFQHLNKSSHNYLRITRILRSIDFLGYGHLQYPWLQFILKESRSKNTLLPNLRGGCRTFWIDSLNNDDDRVSAMEIITMSEADFEKTNAGEEDSDKREADKDGESNRHAQDRDDEVCDKANSKEKATNGKEDYNKPEADKEGGTNRHSQDRVDEVSSKANSKNKATNVKEDYNKPETDNEGESERHAQNRVDEVGDKADSKDPSTYTQKDRNGRTDRIDSNSELEKDDSNDSNRSGTNNRDNEAIQLNDGQRHNFATGEHSSLNF